MEKNGFFCFSLALIFAVSTLALFDAGSAIREKLMEAKTAAISLEQSSLKRFEIEQNADKAISFAMEKSIREGNESAEQAKQNADNALWELFEKEKNESAQKIEFYSATAAKKEYSRIALSKNRLLEKKDVSENTKAIILSIEGLAFIAEYSVTGGILKNKVFFAAMEQQKSSQVFLMPADYSNKTLVVK